MPVQKNGRDIFNDSDINNPDIDGGTVDGATIATSNITVGAGKTLDVSAGTLTLAADQISGDKVEGGTIAAITITALTTTTQADNNSSTLPATTAFAKAEDAVLRRGPTQAVNMTAAASGSNGIAVADDDDIDFGTGNFTLVWNGNVPDYTPAADVILMQKTDATNGWLLQIDTTGVLQLLLNADAARSSTAAPSIVDGTNHEIVCVVTRETAAVAGSVVFYVDGVALGNSVAITAGAPTTVNNAVSLYVAGTSAVRTASNNQFVATYNRALTAAEVLDLYRNGIAAADKYGSQTSIVTGNDSTFSGASNWANGSIATYDETTGGVLTITANGIGQYCRLPVANATTVIGKKYRLTMTIGSIVSSWNVLTYDSTSLGIIVSANGTQSWEFTATKTGGLQFDSRAVDSSMTVDDVLLYKIGATLALEPDLAQPVPGMWLDASTNKLHAIYPAAGASLTRPKQEFTVKWTNTWSATHEAQYLGANQSMLPANCYITNIIGVITGKTIEDIILGDGSDTDHWVAATTGLAAGTVNFTIANAYSDGTNFKLIVDPDANFTGSIAWTIRGIILEA